MYTRHRPSVSMFTGHSITSLIPLSYQCISSRSHQDQLGVVRTMNINKSVTQQGTLHKYRIHETECQNQIRLVNYACTATSGASPIFLVEDWGYNYVNQIAYVHSRTILPFILDQNFQQICRENADKSIKNMLFPFSRF